MDAVDFGRSFVTFVTQGRANNARIQVEACCRLWEDEDEAGEEFYLVASCKSEDTYAEGSLFTAPNYDFCGVFNQRQYSIIRTPASARDWRPESGTVAGRFERVDLQIRRASARVLEEGSDIVGATLAGLPIVARTEIADPTGRFHCRLEYPVKTMNANDIRSVFQVDTGPVPFPDWQAQTDVAAGRFRLAFVALNRPDRAEFVILAPTEIAPGAETMHYSEIVSVRARSEVLALE